MKSKLMALFSIAAGFALADTVSSQLSKAPLETADQVKAYKSQVEQQVNEWNTRIDQVKREASKSDQVRQARLQTIVRELETHRDRIADELGRIQEGQAGPMQQPARTVIDQHFKQMDQLYSAHRPDNSAGQTHIQ